MGDITPPRIEGRVRVRDGRKLGFAEFGPPDGRPILWLHGTPGARRQIPEEARLAAEDVGVRFVGVDRPGTGMSSSHLYGSIVEFMGDLEILLDELGFDELAVVGLSGGGPYALATGHAMPDRVKAVGVLGGVAPTRGEDAASGGLVSLAVRFAPLLPPFRVPLGLALGGLVMLLMPIGPQALAAYARISPPGDREVFAREEIKQMFLDDLTDTGGRLRAPIDDAILFTRDWGFRLREVKVPVKWWHGDADHIVPLAHGEHCVDRLPDAELFVRPGESHLGGFGAAEEVLKTVLAAWDSNRVKETAT
jgi:pimeloyl-ACP methyl ester carboxylesterase